MVARRSPGSIPRGSAHHESDGRASSRNTALHRFRSLPLRSLLLGLREHGCQSQRNRGMRVTTEGCHSARYTWCTSGQHGNIARVRCDVYRQSPLPVDRTTPCRNVLLSYDGSTGSGLHDMPAVRVQHCHLPYGRWCVRICILLQYRIARHCAIVLPVYSACLHAGGGVPPFVPIVSTFPFPPLLPS